MLRLSSAIRPRWSLKYCLVSAGILYVTLCTLLGMPFLSSNLPAYSGNYEVGTIDLEVPCERRKVSDLVFKDTGKPAFELETVLFSLYYPAVKGAPPRAPPHPWVPKPIALHGEGYARFAKINNFLTNNVFTFTLWSLAGSTTIPAAVDVPLHGTVKTYNDIEREHNTADDYGLPKFPVIVFSHGMASSRTSYTQYCAELASRGYIVAAIEHRDGSGPGTVIMNEKEARPLFHINEDSLHPRPEIADLKTAQLAMREAEVKETVRVLRDINDGMGQWLHETNPREEGHDLAEWRGRLMMDRFLVAGHSYGATLALQTLREGPSHELPFVGAIILDPGKQSGPLNDDINVPTLIVHSQSWSAKHTIFHGRPHFNVVKDLVRKIIDEKHKYAWFATAKGTTHPSVTDAPLIEPFLLSWTTGSTISAKEGVMQYIKITMQFLYYLETGHRKSILREMVTHEEYDDPNARAFNPKVAKYWQMHMSPVTWCPAPGYCGVDDPDNDGE